MGPIHPGVPPRPHAPRLHALAPRTDGTAIAALLLGISSLACLGAVTGLPAIILGARARRDIDHSGGALVGSGLAAGGIVAGMFGTGIGAIALLFVLGGAVELAQGSANEATAVTMPVPVASGTRSYGSLDVVDLAEETPLRTQLASVVGDARARGRTVVLQTYVRTSPRCAQIAASLPDLRMQRALANVTLVRVDVEAYESELQAMRIETQSAPWFYKLDGAALPTDALSADEWRVSVPEEMAPPLARFVRGVGRRRP